MPSYTPLTPHEASMLAALEGGKLVPNVYYYVAVEYTNGTTEVYTHETGGSGGATVATVTVNYTDDTKANVSSEALSTRLIGLAGARRGGTTNE